MRGLFLLMVAVFLLAWTPGESSDFKIIVHPDNPTSSLSAKAVSDYLLKKRGRWTRWNREMVEPIDLEAASPVRKAFTRAVHGRSVSSIKSYWQRQIFSGRGVPPPQAASDAEVVRFVAARSGAIGYVSSGTALNGVKEITIAN